MQIRLLIAILIGVRRWALTGDNRYALSLVSFGRCQTGTTEAGKTVLRQPLKWVESDLKIKKIKKKLAF